MKKILAVLVLVCVSLSVWARPGGGGAIAVMSVTAPAYNAYLDPETDSVVIRGRWYWQEQSGQVLQTPAPNHIQVTFGTADFTQIFSLGDANWAYDGTWSKTISLADVETTGAFDQGDYIEVGFVWYSTFDNDPAGCVTATATQLIYWPGH